MPISGLKRLFYRIRASARDASELTTISFSFRPQVTLDAIRTHSWQRNDLQWVLCGTLLLVAFFIAEAPFFFKLGFITLLGGLLLVPITSQFFLPFLPVATWLIFFFSCRYDEHLCGHGTPLTMQIHPFQFETSHLRQSTAGTRKHSIWC